MTDAIKIEDTMFVTPCCSCGIVFGMPTKTQKIWENTHQFFYCPNGHQQHWSGETIEQKELKELRTKVTTLEAQVSSLKEQLTTALSKNEQLTTELEIWKTEKYK